MMLYDLGRDCRYALRNLRRAPGFASVVILTLALGIGANAVIFSAMDAVLLRDAPVADPDQVVSVYTSSGDNPYATSSYADYVDLRDSGTFGGTLGASFGEPAGETAEGTAGRTTAGTAGGPVAGLAAQGSTGMTLDANGQTEAIAGEIVSGNYFDVLGVRIPFGRTFAPEEDRVGTPMRVAVLSYGLWERVFNGNRSAIGQAIRLNGNAYTLIGVAPRGFAGPILGRAADVWVPMAVQPEVRPASAALRRARGHARLFETRSSRWMTMIGRLPKGVTIARAVSGAEVVASRLRDAHPQSNRNRRFTVVPFGDGPGVRQSARPMLHLLAGAVAIVLLIACANVASLLLARAVSRRREVAVRVAIGAGRARLIRQWLAESVLLALLGSIGALLIAWWGTPLLHTFGIPEAIDLSVNPRVLGFTLLVSVGSGLLFGLAPVFQTLHRDTIAALREEGGAVATGARAARMRSAFVILQVALSLVLLIGAGLFLRTLENAYAVDLGYQVDRTVVAGLNLDVVRYSEEAGLATYERILARVEALPGVVAAGAARTTVLSGGARLTGVSIDGRPMQPDNSNTLGVRVNIVSHRYLEAMNIPILRGRSFASSDRPGTPRVIVVTRSMADRVWPHEDPIGKTLGDENGRLHVIGVVPDTVYTGVLERNAPPTFYLLLAQNYESGVTLHVRTAGDPMSLAPAIRDVVRQVDSQLALGRPQRLRELFDQSLSRERMMGTLVGLFGAVALLLAVVGLYGVMAHVATERTTEIGIRLAMGAQPGSILALLLGQGLRLVAIGSAIGLAGALMGTRYVAAQLYGVEPTDLLTFAAVCVVLAIAGLTACAIPARRAMRVDPIIALRRA